MAKERLSRIQKSILTVLRVMDETESAMNEAEYKSLKNRQGLIQESDEIKPAEIPPYWQEVKESGEHEDYEESYWFVKEGVKSLAQKNLGLEDSKAFDASFSRTLKSLWKKDYIERAHSTKKIERSSRWKPIKHQADYIKLTEKGINVNL